MKKFLRTSIVFIAFTLSACYSATVYQPEASYTEAELNLVFDSEGFRGVNGWVWQMGTLTYTCNKNMKCNYLAWPEEEDLLEEWNYIITNMDATRSRRRNTPYK